jgi:ATP-dependent RNA helicase DeaD
VPVAVPVVVAAKAKKTPQAPAAPAITPVVPAVPTAGEVFAALGLSAPLVQAVVRSGYQTPTPIQAQTIPIMLSGRDLLGQAQTGSGKTAAFALPLVQRIDSSLARPQVLVLVPTRELAIQVGAAFERYASGVTQIRVATLYGGAAYQPQFSMLKRGAQVVVGTPGRVMDHMNRGSLQLDALQCLVLDEADEMLRMGFAESVDWVLSHLPAGRQIALFSATLPGPIRQMAQQYLREPAEITIRQKTATADTIRQRFLVVSNHLKEAALARVLEAEQIEAAIVFVRLKSTTEPLAEYLSQRGFRAAALNGDIVQSQRERIIDHLKSGRLDIVVATDVAARGLDVQRISHVINYDLPGDDEAYVHRIGRTGRAGRSGEAILFMHPKAQRALRGLEHATRQKFEPMELPSNRVINKQRVARFHQRITESVNHPLAESLGSIIEQFRRENPDMPIAQLLAALGVMVVNGQPLLLKDEVVSESFHEVRRPRDGRREGPGRPVHGGRFEDRRGGRGSFGAAGEFAGDDRPRRPRGPRGAEPGMETFRVEVGHVHQVKPGNIVGAIANEAGLDAGRIGRIEIFDEFSTVDLPAGMPPAIFHALQKVWVSGRQLRISHAGGNPPVERNRYEGQRSEGPPHGRPRRPFREGAPHGAPGGPQRFARSPRGQRPRGPHRPAGE